MRTVKASEVVKGMRVRVEQRFTHPPLVKGGAEDETIETIEGTVTISANAIITFANGDTRYLGYDHPVTVLAEPEPEWVEGAWCWVEFTSGGRRPMFRDNGLWSAFPGGSGMRYEDDEVTILGRVLIVDWPGDDVAEAIEDDNPPRTEPTDMTAADYAAQIIADAIRTQGGVR